MQQLIVYAIVLSSVIYLGSRVYAALVKKKSAGGCADCKVRQVS